MVTIEIEELSVWQRIIFYGGFLLFTIIIVYFLIVLYSAVLSTKTTDAEDTIKFLVALSLFTPYILGIIYLLHEKEKKFIAWSKGIFFGTLITIIIGISLVIYYYIFIQKNNPASGIWVLFFYFFGGIELIVSTISYFVSRAKTSSVIK
ncbi:MAG: hypothetical protein AABW65_02600 [Nanoarchaeota archaeon]